MIILRPDQQQLKADIYGHWSNGARNVLAVLPTGGGKSVITSDIVLDGHNQGIKECIMAHRNELVSQLSGHVARRGIPHRLIAPKKTISKVIAEHREEFGRSFISPDANCAVGGVDTILARLDVLKSWLQQVGRWTLDEAHHIVIGNKWHKVVEAMPNAFGLGVTACPKRGDGKGLGSHHDGVFDAMAIGPDMRALINLGALTDYMLALPESDLVMSDDDITDKGDYSPAKLKKAAEKSRIVGDVVREYVKHALGKRAICFATDVETAGKIANSFNDIGISAAAVSGDSDEGYRREMVRRFRDGRLTILINVDLFDEGFDVPGCEVVIMARPTASLNKYLQMFGRALRTMAGKLFGLIIDHVGNWKRHGPPDAAHYWTLDRADKRGKKTDDPELIKESACLTCSRPYPRVFSTCPYCGAERPLPEPGARTIEQVDGDLILLGPEQLAALRAGLTLDNPGDVSARAGMAAGPIAAAAAAKRQMEKHEAQAR